jgi:hypothetical protein
MTGSGLAFVGPGSPVGAVFSEGQIDAQVDLGGQSRQWNDQDNPCGTPSATASPLAPEGTVPHCPDYADQIGPATPLTSTDQTGVGIIRRSA